MRNIRERALSILELLAHRPTGLPQFEIADQLGIPRSAAHRLLADLKESGYVRQDREGGVYLLTAKLVSLALAYLNGNGIIDIAQPMLDQLAVESGELVRLAVIDGERLTWVAKAQGARHGLRYDPDAGLEIYLAATANGLAWLSCLSDEAALELVVKQGFERREKYGPNAPRTLQDLIAQVQETRARGFSMVSEAYEVGTSAIAAPIRRPDTREPVGTISIAGPSVRMNEARMKQLAPSLISTAMHLGAMSRGSPLFTVKSVAEGANHLPAAE